MLPGGDSTFVVTRNCRAAVDAAAVLFVRAEGVVHGVIAGLLSDSVEMEK